VGCLGRHHLCRQEEVRPPDGSRLSGLHQVHKRRGPCPRTTREALARGKRREKSTLMHHDFEPAASPNIRRGWLISGALSAANPLRSPPNGRNRGVIGLRGTTLLNARSSASGSSSAPTSAPCRGTADTRRDRRVGAGPGACGLAWRGTYGRKSEERQPHGAGHQ